MTDEILLDVDFETPQFLVHHYYIAGSISIMINTFVFYLLLFHKGKMDSFRYYMLAFQIACSLVDIHLTFLMQPVTLFPLPSGYCIGALVKLFDASPHFLMAIIELLVGYQVNVLNLCFLRKHKAITKIINKYVLPENVYNAIVFFFMTYTFSYVIPFSLAHLTKEEEYHIIDTSYPKLRHKFEELPNFAMYEFKFIAFQLFLIMIVAGCIQSTITVSVLTFQMYQVLMQCKLSLSKSTWEKHKTALKSLVLQFMTTPIAILPSMLLMSTIYVPFKGAQVFTCYMLMIITTHSTINCLIVIFTIPQFRSIVLMWIEAGKKLKRIRMESRSVSFVGTRVAPNSFRNAMS
ncbi:hypothetical protein CRE_14890 [Caenorhabditis remanei]|uniref:Serpentine Receptor, class I n=1 Tax=Caenorhabditis remanei TaxID=31234 RepID=E3N1X5_CAERE|nr:hypothetical protein CRE_14890 [Caenorhabditis remanei]